MTVGPEDQWRIDNARHVRVWRLQFQRYTRWSESWDHDHCAACWATFAELDEPDVQHAGYATREDYPKGARYDWVCVKCFNDLREEMGWKAVIPPPAIEFAVSAKSPSDVDRLRAALAQLTADSLFPAELDRESERTIVRGMQEADLDVIADRLKHKQDIGIDADVTVPRVLYYETITHSAEADYAHKKVFASGSGEFARVKIRFEPLPRGFGFEFESGIPVGSVPEACIPGVKKGLVDALKVGAFSGHPVIDLKATLVDAAYHDSDSSPRAFEMAARGAAEEGIRKGGPVLLEPVITVTVVVSLHDDLGAVLDDLAKRGAKITERSAHRGADVIKAKVALASMLGYSRSLISLSEGRAACDVEFSHYAPAILPGNDPRFRPAMGMHP